MNNEDQQVLNWERYKTPNPGDYWYSNLFQDNKQPMFVVLAVGYKDIAEDCIFVVCDHVINAGKDNWKFDLTKSKIVGYDYFEKLRKGIFPKFCADVYSGDSTRPMIEKWVQLGHPIIQENVTSCALMC